MACLNINMNLCWFNGPSARQFLHIPRQSFEIGCNFIEQHRPVDHVCAYDRQCLERIKPRPERQYWTRNALSHPGWKCTDSQHRSFDSGTLAMIVAHTLGLEHIYLIGCDWQHTNASIYDQLYEWRNYQPKKASLPKQKLLERLHSTMSITIVTDRPWRMGVDFLSPKDFSRTIRC